jgi:hypothetical protein
MAKKKLHPKNGYTFKFAPHPTLSRGERGRSIRAGEIKNLEDLPPFIIRGQVAGSKDEWWVSLALERIEAETGWGWSYQVPVYGGRNIAHGNVIDFLVYTPGQWTILDPMGAYWHTGKHEDRDEMQNVARHKKWKLIAWFTSKTPTREKVYAFLRDQMNV